MRPQRQTTFGGPNAAPEEVGNCFAACVATLFGFDVDLVPNFCAAGDVAWWDDLVAWSIRLGFTPMCVRIADWPEADRKAWWKLFHGMPVIAGGPGPRGHLHAVIYRDGALEWDPHPSDAGLLGVEDVIFFIARDPHDLFAKVRALGVDG